MSRQFIESSYCVLFASDIQASMKWYCKLFGFYVMEAAAEYAVLETSPGQILYLSTSEQASRYFVVICKDIPPSRQHLMKHDIVFEEDLPHWLVFRDPDYNKIGVWSDPGGMNLVDFEIPEWIRETNRDMIRFRMDSIDELHIVIKRITDQSDFIAASTELLEECNISGVKVLGNTIRMHKYSNQVDASYAGVPVKQATNLNLSNGLEYMSVPAQEYTVYPIQKSKMEASRTNELANRVHHSKEGLSRSGPFYILEHILDDDYIEAYIPFERK